VIPPRGSWRTPTLGVVLGVTGIGVDNITFADRRGYWVVAPVALVLMAMAGVIACVRLTKTGWRARILWAILLLALLLQICDTVLRRIPALLGLRL
jgi:hypothetical protein